MEGLRHQPFDLIPSTEIQDLPSSAPGLLPHRVGFLQLLPQVSAFPSLKSEFLMLHYLPEIKRHLIITTLKGFKSADKRDSTKSNCYGHCHFLDFEGWVLPDADFPDQIRADTFFCVKNSSCLCETKLKNHYLLCTMLTSQRRPVHSVSIDEEQKNSLLCMMKKNLCNHLHFP